MMTYLEWLRVGNVHNDSEDSQTLCEIADSIETLTQALAESADLTEQADRLSQQANFQKQWAEGTRTLYSTALNSQILKLENRLANSVRSAIAPLLEEGLVKKGMEDFCNILKRHLDISPLDTPKVVVPHKWQAQLAERLSAAGITAEIEPTDHGEVRTTVDQTEIETDLGEWIDRLRKAAA